MLDTYEPAPLHESDSDFDDIPSISYTHKVALDSLADLCLFRFQNAHVSSQKGGQLEPLLYREKRDIEGL